jgi:hypothetical protein
MSKVLLQRVKTTETRTILAHCVMRDVPYKYATYDTFNKLSAEDVFDTLPVGSVEYIRHYARINEITIPQFDCYPKELLQFIKRKVELIPIDRLPPISFIKPVQTKLFTGFVYDKSKDYSEEVTGSFLHEEYALFNALPKDTLVYCSEIIDIESEWRFYIQGGKISGIARYDDSEIENVPTPPMELIKSMVDAFVGAPVCYTIDIAMKPDGEVVLMECNDAWAIGLYDKCMTSAEYYDFLKSRWSQILSQLTQSQQFGME